MKICHSRINIWFSLKSCHTAFLILLLLLSTRKNTFSCIFDVSQAYESVWHIVLQYMLKQYFPLLITFYINLTFTNNCLQNRFFKVKLDDYDDYDILAGVPQGSSDIAPFFLYSYLFIFSSLLIETSLRS